MKGKKLTLKEKIDRLEQSKIERQKLCKLLCTHLQSGLSMECFSEVSDHTLERYMKQYPEDFPQEDIAIARKQGREYWETLGKRQSAGDCLGNSRTWFYNMANRFGWRDKIDVEAEHKGALTVNVVNYATSKGSQGTVSNDIP